MPPNDLAQRFIFDVRAPVGVSPVTNGPVTSTQLLDLIREMNLVYLRIGSLLKEITGFSGTTPRFAADTDFQRHRLLNVADPIQDLDGVNLRTLEEGLARIREDILRLQQLLHGELPALQKRDISVTRSIPTGAHDTVMVGSFQLQHDAHSIDMAVTVRETANTSLAKRYLLEIQRGINSAWQIAAPISDTGPSANSDNFDVDVWQEDAANQMHVRLRRTAGTSTAATALIHIHQRGLANDIFLASSTGAVAVTPPTLYLESAVLTQVSNRIGVNGVPEVTCHIRDENGQPVYIDVLHAANAPYVIQRRARGSLATGAAQVQANDAIGGLRGRGWTSSGGFSLTAASVVLRAAENFTASARGTTIELFTTPIGSTSMAERGRIDSPGNLLWGTTTSPSSATQCIVVANGTAPSSDVSGQHSYLSTTTSTSITAVPTWRCSDSNIVRLFKLSALTSTSGTAFSAATTSGTNANDQTIINNVITRVSELENRLQSLGII